MNDIKILAIRDLLTISFIEYATGVSPLSVLVTGEKFNEASKVLINDSEAPEFMVLSRNKILAQVPDGERRSVLSKVAVLAEAPSVTRSSILHFDVGNGFKKLKGVERMVQLFVKRLLQTPGSDKFDRAGGGGLLSIVGRSVSRQDTRSVQAAVVGAIGRTRDQILALQSQNNRIPSDERLLTVKAEAVGFNPSTTTISARIAISAVSGRQAVANLTF